MKYPFRFLIFVVLLLPPTTWGASTRSSPLRSFGAIAEEELKIQPKASPSAQSIQIDAVAPLSIDEPADWTFGFSLESFHPAGFLSIVTGDRYDLNQVGSQPMIGVEICHIWNPQSPLLWSTCFSINSTAQEIQLQTQSGYQIEHVRLTHIVSSAGGSAEHTFSERLHLSAIADLRIGALLISQSSPNLAGNASKQSPLLLLGPGVKWTEGNKFFAKLGYQHWIGSDVPENHFVLTGGFLF